MYVDVLAHLKNDKLAGRPAATLACSRVREFVCESERVRTAACFDQREQNLEAAQAIDFVNQ